MVAVKELLSLDFELLVLVGFFGAYCTLLVTVQQIAQGCGMWAHVDLRLNYLNHVFVSHAPLCVTEKACRSLKSCL